VWRDAFQKFKTKKGARSSIEALLKRVSKGNAVGTINPLVDIYNACSMKFALPNGGEDIDKFQGDVRLTFADGNEEFVTLGSEKSEPPLEAELVYKDDAGAICRCWNWREAVRTMLTEETKNAFLCIESVDPDRQDDFNSALDYLQENVTEKLGAKCKVFVLDINKQYIEF
jgi:DNA/RNA-binding domain of Phe-tRNA-synthetase-like protein